MQRQINGFTLFEVLIAIFILSVGLLGIARLQIMSLRNNYQAFTQSVADNQLQNFVESMRANPDPKAVQREYKQWENETKYLIPTATSKLALQETEATVSLHWQGFDRDKTSQAAFITWLHIKL